MTSSFPPRTLAVGTPLPPPSPSASPSQTQSQTRLHTVDHRAADYNNYSETFSEVTAYDNSNRFAAALPSLSPRPSQSPASTSPSTRNALTLTSSSSSSTSRQLEAFGNKFLSAITESVKAPPAVAGLSRTKSLHARAKSLASFVPSLSSLTVEEEHSGSLPRPRKPRASASFFGSNSIRRPSTAHVDDDEEQEQQPQDFYSTIMEYRSTLTGGRERSTHASEQAAQVQASQALQASQAVQSDQQSISSPTVSRPVSTFRKLGWFGGSKQQQPQPSPSADADVVPAHAELLQPVTTLLFPHGKLDPQDPDSFADLLKNAESLLTRLQAAYKQQEFALKSAKLEREAAIEEAAEAETRARHLKMQLDDMSNQAKEQELAMSAMVEELDLERSKRLEDTDRCQKLQARLDDEPTPKRRSFRNSAGSSNSMHSIASDSGFESDSNYAETETDASTLSRPMTPLYEQQRWETSSKEYPRPSSRGSQSDRTCQVDAGVWVWMREEKGRLERRVKELEVVVDGCLDLVSRA